MVRLCGAGTTRPIAWCPTSAGRLRSNPEPGSPCASRGIGSCELRTLGVREAEMIVVLFSTTAREDVDVEDYRRTSARMRELVATIPGFISYNVYQGENGEGVAVVRFDSEEALEAWRGHPEHQKAQQKGRSSYYQDYWVQVCSTLREYRFTSDGRYESDLRAMFASDSTISSGRLARRRVPEPSPPIAAE